MLVQEVIKKAVEGGFKGKSYAGDAMATQLLDPDFWQSLGKAMGFNESIYCSNAEHINRKVLCDECVDKEDGWKNEWHALIDHLAEGKSIESFFKEL